MWLFNPWAWNISRRTEWKKKKKDKKIIDEDTKTKNVFSEKKDRIRHTPRRK